MEKLTDDMVMVLTKDISRVFSEMFDAYDDGGDLAQVTKVIVASLSISVGGRAEMSVKRQSAMSREITAVIASYLTRQLDESLN